MAKCNKIRHIVRIRQMLRSWRKKATANHRLPSDVPAGHVAICVGASFRRFVVRAAYLNHPIFRGLLSQAEEEYGFGNYSGPLVIPCDELLFEDILLYVSLSEPDFQRCCHVGVRSENANLMGESQPLLYGFTA